MQTSLPHSIENRNPKRIFIHYGEHAPTIVEAYCPTHLSEYVRAGFAFGLNRDRDEVHGIHPNAPYSARA